MAFYLLRFMRNRYLSYPAGRPTSPSLLYCLRQVGREGRAACSPVQTGTLGGAGLGPTSTHGAVAAPEVITYPFQILSFWWAAPFAGLFA